MDNDIDEDVERVNMYILILISVLILKD